MAITCSSTNRITLTKETNVGDTLAHAYTLQNIYDADVSNGWGVVTKSGLSYIFQASVYIDASTYVWFYNANIDFQDTFTDGNAIYNNAGYFQVGSDPISAAKCGCSFMIDTSAVKSYYFKGYNKVYDTLFNARAASMYTLWLSGNADIPAEFKRIQINNSQYVANKDSAGMTSYANVIFDDITVQNSAYGIKYNSNFNSIKGYNVIGKAVTILGGAVEIYTSREWNIPRASYDMRAYHTSFVTWQLIDCVPPTSLPYPNVSNALATTGAKGIIDLISTFSFVIGNAQNASLEITDSSGNIAYTGSFDSSSAIDDIELMYKEVYAEKLAVGYDYHTTIYQPFNVKITRTGYQNLEINNISVVDGIKTNIIGQMVDTPAVPTVYVDQSISGSIEGITLSGNIESNNISGTVSQVSLTGSVVNNSIEFSLASSNINLNI